MNALKKAPLRVRDHLNKAYEIEKERVDMLVKKLQDHSDVQVKYGLSAKTLKDKALASDKRALKLRHEIRKMEKENARRTSL